MAGILPVYPTVDELSMVTNPGFSAVASVRRMPSLTMVLDMATVLDMVMDTEESPDTQVAAYLTVDVPSMVFVVNAQHNLSSLDMATLIMHDLDILLFVDLVWATGQEATISNEQIIR